MFVLPTPPASRPVLAVALAALLAPAAARAHDLWLERSGAALVLRYGHRGGEALPLERAKVKAFRCGRDGAGRDPLADVEFADREARLPARCAAASAAYDGGYWSLTPDGEKNLPRTRAPDAVKAWASRQYAKWVDPAAGGGDAVLGDELELVAVTDLRRVHAGDKVTVKVLHLGAPVAGAVVAIDHRALGETDGAGQARVRVRAADVETLSATLRRRLGTPEAETEVLEASLSFEVAR